MRFEALDDVRATQRAFVNFACALGAKRHVPAWLQQCVLGLIHANGACKLIEGGRIGRSPACFAGFDKAQVPFHVVALQLV